MMRLGKKGLNILRKLVNFEDIYNVIKTSMTGNHNLLKWILAIIFLASGFYVDAQEKICAVKLPGLSGTYTGGCKNGLAEGRGTAQGIDKYYGQFHQGLPDGAGTYIWANGAYYEGHWKNGLKDGKGKMVYRQDSVISGYWKDNKYVGEQLIQPYRIKRTLSVTRSTFNKLPGTVDFVRLRFFRGGTENADIIDLSLAYDSGQEIRLGPSYGIQNPRFPLEVIVRFRAWNAFHTTQYDGDFEFEINDPGNWEVTVFY
jgi:hypothetical protein